MRESTKRRLAGVHFTGSNGTFDAIWHRVGVNVRKGAYRNYPRLVGETGGKDFVVAAADDRLPAHGRSLGLRTSAGTSR